MAGTIATIIALELDKEYSERAIVKALKVRKGTSDIRVQPAGNGYAYLVLKNRLKSQAETELTQLVDLYKGFGGQEFNQDVLPEGAPEPAIDGINNSAVEFYNPPKGTYCEDENGQPYFKYD